MTYLFNHFSPATPVLFKSSQKEVRKGVKIFQHIPTRVNLLYINKLIINNVLESVRNVLESVGKWFETPTRSNTFHTCFGTYDADNQIFKWCWKCWKVKPYFLKSFLKFLIDRNEYRS